MAEHDETVAHRVRALIGGHLAGPDVAGDDDNLVEDLGADSLDQVEITMMVEEEFGLDIADTEAEACPTVGDWVALVDRKIAERAAS